jgi:hypothetical protein
MNGRIAGNGRFDGWIVHTTATPGLGQCDHFAVSRATPGSVRDGH